MADLKPTWGKTWHTWPDPKDPLRLGEPVLMWAYEKDGQIDKRLIESRDRDLKIDTAAIRKRRAERAAVRLQFQSEQRWRGVGTCR
jgi:hypothetical protein